MRDEWQEAPPDIDAAPLFASEDEKCLVGSMMFDPDRVPDVLKTIGRQHFADAALREVFTAIAKHYREADGDGQALAAKVMVALRDQPAVDNPRGLLLDVAESVATGAHVETFAANVADAALKRRIVEATEVAHKAAQKGKAGGEVLADLMGEIESLQDASERKGGIKQFTAGQLRDQFPKLREPLLDGLLRMGETANFIGDSKVGKSFGAVGMGLSIVTGRPWLGRFPTRKGRVLLIDNELHPELVNHRLAMVADAMGIALEEYRSNFIVWTLRGNLRSLSSLVPEFNRFDKEEISLIICDAKYRFNEPGSDENANGPDDYNQIDAIAEQTGAAVLLVHHLSKGNQSDKKVTDTGAGGGVQSRAADAHMVLRPHEAEDAFVLDAALRSFPKIEPMVLRCEFPLWVPDNELDPTALAGRTSKNQKDEDRERLAEEKREMDRTKVWAAMGDLKGPETTAMIAGAAGLSGGRTSAAIGWLVANNMAEAAEVTRMNNQTYSGFELTEEGRGGVQDAA